MRKILTIAMLVACALFMVSCGEDDSRGIVIGLSTYTVIDASTVRGPDEDNVTLYPQNEVTGVIDEDVVFTNDVAWVLNGRVVVDAGATLTIDEGTIIKGTPGQGALSSVLLVASGATVNVNGTSSNPVVMTALSDHVNVAGLAYWDGASTTITAGTDPGADGFTSRGLDPNTDVGLWGGFIVLGDAPISDANTTAVIEGIPESVVQASYGGTDAIDNSGSVTYLSIRFTGAQLGPGNELQGLTLGGVGSGTTISWVESVASADDGTEIFGGSVNMSNFIVWGQADDGYDADQAWTGTVDNFLYFGTFNGGSTSDHAFELDGPEGSAKGTGTFTNGFAWGDVSDGMVDLRDDAEYVLNHIVFYRFGTGADIEMDEDGDAFTNSENYLGTGKTVLTNLQFSDNDNNTLAAIMDAKGDETNNYAALADTQFAEARNSNSILATLGDATVGPTVGTTFDWSYTAQEFTGWTTVSDNF